MTLAAVFLQFVLAIPVELVAMFIGQVSGGPRVSAMEHPGLIALVNLASLGAVIAWGVYQNGAPWHVVLPLRPLRPAQLLAIVITILGGVILISEVDNVFRRLLPMPEVIVEVFRKLFHHPKHAWAAALAIVIVAPVTEEPLFRGLILRGLLARSRTGTAVLLSAALFGLAHLNPWQFVSAALLGVLFGWWYVRTRSLVPGLIGHALANGLVLSATSLPFRVQGFNDTQTYAVPVLQPLWFDAIGVALTALGLGLFHRWTPREPPAPPGMAAALPDQSGPVERPPEPDAVS